tara:strand:- start:166 stop:399 length:234 start_codon:yes stop_codon:yes gene_type:complete
MSNLLDYFEDISSEVAVDLSNTNRKYQTSNVIVQDPQKEGILTFLKENVQVQPEQQPAQGASGQAFRPYQDSSVGNN